MKLYKLKMLVQECAYFLSFLIAGSTVLKQHFNWYNFI